MEKKYKKGESERKRHWESEGRERRSDGEMGNALARRGIYVWVSSAQRDTS